MPVRHDNPSDNPSAQFHYRHKASEGTLLYVGITTDWPTRMKQHQADKPWWSEVLGVELVRLDCTRPQVEAIEKAVIKAEQPRYNVTHNGEVRRTLAAPVPVPDGQGVLGARVRREPLFWREEQDGSCTYFYAGDRVYTIGRLSTLVDCDTQSEDLDYTVLLDGDTEPTRIDGTCTIRHALPDDEDMVW